MLRSAMIAAALLTLGACVLVRRGNDECRPAMGLTIQPRAVELAPGETLRLKPANLVVGGISPFPERCTAKWTVRGQGVSIDRTGLLTATDAAAVGTRFSVRAERNGRSAERNGLIVSSAPNPLAGAWRQRVTPGCTHYSGPVGELIFQRGGEYLLTEQPFEGQIGEIGTYEYDQQTGRLVLRRGDQVRGQGTARIEGGALVITGDFSFTHAQPRATCTAVFDPMGMPNI
ncbi:MAG TPA: hypothetical protein VFS20_02545 [Longimicrobium sp.]|nr:hypothetical protein [Longimicrobium sp.]